MTAPESTETDESAKHFRTDHLKSDLGQRSARSVFFTLTSRTVKFAVSLGSTIILARILTPEDYGIVGMVAIILNFASMFQYLGLAGATVQWTSLNHRQVSTLFWINLGLSSAIALVMAAASPLLAWFFGEPRLILVTVGYALAVFITGLWIQHSALLTRQMKFGILTFVDTFALVVGVSVAIAAAWYGAGYWALVYNHLVTTSVQAIGYWVGCKWRPGLPIRGSGVKEMLKFGGHFTGSNLTDFFSRNLDNILIGKFWGAEELGLYSRAYQLMLMPIQQISGPIGAVAFPALSRLEDSPAEYRRFYLRIIEKISMVVMPGAALMCATSDWVVQFLIGPQWKETGRIFMFLAACAAVQPITETVVWLFSTQRRTREMLSWSFVAAAISIVSICAGLPWGAVGVAASYSSAYFCLTTPLLFWFVGRRGVVSTLDFYRTLYPSFLAGLASLAVLLLSHWWLATIEPAALRLFTAFLMAGFTSLFVFSVLPRGRMALRHFRDLLVRVVSARDSKLGA